MRAIICSEVKEGRINFPHPLTFLMRGMMNFDDDRVSINVWNEFFPG